MQSALMSTEQTQTQCQGDERLETYSLPQKNAATEIRQLLRSTDSFDNDCAFSPSCVESARSNRSTSAARRSPA
jgi:hypothetical protein